LIVPAIQPSQQAVQVPHLRAAVVTLNGAALIGATARTSGITLPQHFLYFSPLPQEQGSLRPGLFIKLRHPIK
jgi:hypothetical protein